jgi:hypothetical protein
MLTDARVPAFLLGRGDQRAFAAALAAADADTGDVAAAIL